MNRFFRSLFGTPTSSIRHGNHKSSRTRLGCESLESREVLSGSSIGLSPMTGELFVTCNTDNDVAVVSQTGTQLKVTVDSSFVSMANGIPIPMTTRKEATYSASSIKKVVFSGGDGADRFTNETSVQCTASGGNGNDVLIGGSSSDKLEGGIGTDRLEGRGGDDVLIGGVGDDNYVFAGQNFGSDTVTEAANADVDTLDFTAFGPKYFDINNPPAGIKVNLGKTGSQVVGVGNLSIALSNATGLENVLGSTFADDITGNTCANRLEGYGGNDRIFGMAGKDFLYGGDGSDTLVSVDGEKDTVTGGNGNDSYWTDQISLDTIADVSTSETQGVRIHRVGSYADLAQMTTGLTGDITYNSVSFTSVGKSPNGPNLLDPVPCSNDVYKANFQDRPLFGQNGPQLEDIDQNRIPECWLLAALGGMADKNPEIIRQAVTDLGDGTYAVRFQRNGAEVYYRVDADLVTTSAAGTSLRYAAFGHDGSIWPSIIEKAYAFFRRDLGTHNSSVNLGGDQTNVGWYQSLSYGDSSDVGRALGLNSTTSKTSSFASKSAYIAGLRARIDAGDAVILGGPGAASNWSATATERSNAHAWTVVGYTFNSSGQATGLRVRNPYAGPDSWSSELPNQTLSFDAIFASSYGFSAIEV